MNTPNQATSNRKNRIEQDATHSAQFAPFAAKMRCAGLPEAAMRAFEYHYAQLLQGATGYIPGEEAHPVADLPAAVDLNQYGADGKAALNRTVVIKLNGGLGTTMGMAGPKSLIEVKQGLTFLDIIVHQVLHMRQEHNVGLPLVLMNSFNTQDATKQALRAYPQWMQDVPTTFLQHKAPKIWQADLSPVEWPADPQKEWCPPGHGDIYLALQSSGLLDQLLDRGYEFAFVSNSDNLAATVDVAILGYFAQQTLPFLMEVANRTPTDRKGGHLAMHPDKGLILREVAQCPPAELDEFQNIARYRYFNTNNLWVHLPSIQQLLAQTDGLLKLPLIRNEKPVDPTQPDSPPVYQLETAMGQAIALFPDAQAIQTPRSRFLPVKNTNDLLALWSDVYVLHPDYTIDRNPVRRAEADIVIELDETYYKRFDQLKERFPHGAPVLVHCDSLRVEGNVYFDADVELEGDVHIRHMGKEPLVYVATGQDAMAGQS